jgi:DNA-binding response OmpR family regulator
MTVKILLCDDSEDMVMITRFILEGEGYKVLVAKTTDQITELIKQDGISLVLMDINLPPKGGEAAVAEVRKNPKTSDVPVLLLSGQENLDELAEKLSATGYLRKPYDGKSLIRIIKDTLRINDRKHLRAS